MSNNYTVEEGMMHIAIERSLLKISSNAMEKIGEKLMENHGCYFKDCLDHPEYLREVLTETYGKGADAIIENIQQNMSEVTITKKIGYFLTNLR